MTTELRDIHKKCPCGEQFTWTVGEQKFMNQLLEAGKLDGFDELTGEVIPGVVKPPRRCKKCRAAKRNG